MKRAIFAVLGLFLPLAAAAQDAASPAAKPEPGATVIAAAAATQPAPARRSTKRRGSMVGYIEDSTITSQVRFRFDTAFDMDSPDRAEFFYAKCGCYRDLGSSSPAFDPNAPGPGPGIVEGLNFQQFYVDAEFAAGNRVSVFAELPFRWIKPTDFTPGTGSFGNQGGVGDVKVGAKFGLVSEEARDVTVMVRASLPTGDSRKGLGTDHGSIEPAILYRQEINDRVAIETQFGDWHPLNGSKGPFPGNGKFTGDVVYYGIGPSFDVVRTDRVRFSPVVELVGWHVVKGFETKTLLTPIAGDAKGINVVNLTRPPPAPPPPPLRLGGPPRPPLKGWGTKNAGGGRSGPREEYNSYPPPPPLPPHGGPGPGGGAPFDPGWAVRPRRRGAEQEGTTPVVGTG